MSPRIEPDFDACRGHVRSLVVACVMLCLACHDDAPKPTGEAVTPSATLVALGLDASGVGTLVDPPRPAGDLKADIDAFTTIEDCMRDRAKLDPVVADALDNIGYDTFLRDACRVLEAAKKKDARLCTLIDASSLKARCNGVVAVVARTPDRCPRVAARPDRGRDPSCVAQAARSPVLCAGADRHDRVVCAATLGKDDKACEGLLLPDERAACARDVARWRTTLDDGQPALVTSVAPVKASLEVHGAEGHPDPKTTRFDLGPDLSRGVVIVKDAGRWRAAFGDGDDLALTPKATSPLSQARFGFKLRYGPEESAKVDLDDATLSVPGAAAINCATSPCKLSVKTTKLEWTRGGAIALTVDGTVGAGAQAFTVHADLATFVRDAVDPTAE